MNRNSALIWLPIVETLGFRSPKTKVVSYTHHTVVAVLEGEESPQIIIPYPERYKWEPVGACKKEKEDAENKK